MNPKEFSEKKYRHETKHELRFMEYLCIRNRLMSVARTDKNVSENGTYQIRSLYFDNYRDKALREKLDGVNEREKFRIRYYNGNTDVIHLEKKSKINGLCNKIAAPISKKQVEELLGGRMEILSEEKAALTIELYSKMKSEQLRPRVMVDYEREPFIYEPGNVRITFDKNIRSSLYSHDFFTWECPTVTAGMEDGVLMEVKYDEFLPDIIRMCIQENERPGGAFSKYAACRRFG